MNPGSDSYPETPFRQWLRQRLAVQPARPALLANREPTLEYGALDSLISALMADLWSAGVTPHDRIAVLMSAGPDMAIGCLSLMCSAVCVPLNPDSPPLDLEHRLTALGAGWLLCDSEHLPIAASVAESSGLGLLELSRERGTWSGMAVECQRGPVGATDSGDAKGADDPVLCLQTSGSTSEPKIVPLSFNNLDFSVNSLCRSLQLGPSDRCLNMLPMYHVGGLIDLLLGPLCSGGSAYLTTDMSVSSFKLGYQQAQVTWFQAVPTMLQNFVSDAAVEQLEGSKLRFIRTVSAALPNRLLHQVEAVFKTPVIEMYGMTETAGIICSNPLPPAARKQGSVGQPQGLQLRIVNQKSRPQPANQVGEVQVLGSSVFSGYETEPRGKFKEFDGHWLRTGDEGYLDDEGYLYLVGRIKEIINKGGEKIAPLELDRAAELFPEVKEAAAFSVAHQSLGEDIALAVVVRDENHFDERAFFEHLSNHLASFKLPKQVVYLDHLPRTRSGKLQRHRVPQQADERRSRQPLSKTQPVTELQRKLAAIWCELLNLEQVYLEDNFFQAGGDSLNAAVMMMEIQSRLQLEIPMSALFQAPTLGGLAALILNLEDTPVGVQQDVLQQVANELGAFMSGWRGERVKKDGLLIGRNTAGNRQPLFWGVNAYPEFDGLANALPGNQPLYGFRSLYKTNFRYRVNPAQLAKLYFDEIRSIQPVGPYLIGGFCEAGKVAFELAEMLLASGEQVSSLMLQDRFIAKPYQGRVACFLCAASKNSPFHRFHRPLEGWRKYYSGELVLYHTRIKHQHVYRHPQVTIVAEQIAHEIRIAQNGGQASADLRNRLQVLPAEAYRAKLSCSAIPTRVMPLGSIKLQVTIQNSSSVTWLPSRRSGLLLAARWRNHRNVIKHWCTGISQLAESLEPGQTTMVTISIRVPWRPGRYTLELDMVDDGIAWFCDQQQAAVSGAVQVSLLAFAGWQAQQLEA